MIKRLFLLLFFASISLNLYAQNNLFVRVYDLKDKKIEKGQILAVNDSILRLKKNGAYIDIPVNTIGTIRTKRSHGNNFLVGSLIGAGFMGGVGVATARPDEEWFGYTPAEGAAIGIIIGAPVGALIGGATGIFKNSKTFDVSGSLEKWKLFEEYFSQRSNN